jgi:Flp pilus assembly secretin CpaC
MKTIRLKAAALTAAALTLVSAAFADALYVETGKATPLRINGTAASIVIGNKNIADVSVHNEQLLFLTGKSYGTTNLLVFDKSGREILNTDVMVTAGTTSLVTVNRAGQNFTYDCSPTCKAVLSTGDDPTFFSTLVDQQLQSQALTSGQ